MRTNPLWGGGKELNKGRGSVVDSNFICSEYDAKENQAANEIDSWKYLGEVDTFGNNGIQGRHIAEYFEQRQPKGVTLPNYFLWGGV